MKRLLSWVILIACSIIAEFALVLLVELGFWLVTLVVGAGLVALILFFVFCEGTLLSAVVILPIVGSKLSVAASQKVCKSRRGTRYSVFAWFRGVLAALNLLGYLFVLVDDFSTQTLCSAVGAGVLLYYEIMVYVAGAEAVASDGAPETKAERLQRKLNKELEKENRKKALAVLEQMEREGIDVQGLVRAAAQTPSACAEQAMQTPQDSPIDYKRMRNEADADGYNT